VIAPGSDLRTASIPEAFPPPWQCDFHLTSKQVLYLQANAVIELAIETRCRGYEVSFD
jgi:hypothetical protein